MKRAPYVYKERERRRERANSHFCDTAGSTVFCLESDCPYCSEGSE
jgi:hypothetical protein